MPMAGEGETGQESVGDPEERSETECSMKEEGRGKGPRERRGRVGPLLDGVVHCDADANANAEMAPCPLWDDSPDEWKGRWWLVAKGVAPVAPTLLGCSLFHGK